MTKFDKNVLNTLFAQAETLWNILDQAFFTYNMKLKEQSPAQN